MNILAFDSSTPACSAAIQTEQQLLQRFELAPRRHHQLLLPMIESLLVEAKLSLSDMDYLAISHGPGSFTGLRIAAGVAQGIAMAMDIPVVSVSSLQTIAQGMYREHGYQRVLVIEDAQMEQVYVGKYYYSGKEQMLSLAPDQLLSLSELTLSTEAIDCIVGSGWVRYRQQMFNGVVENIDMMEVAYYPHAQDILMLVAAQNLCQHPQKNQILPNYLRQEDSWKTLARQQKDKDL